VATPAPKLTLLRGGDPTGDSARETLDDGQLLAALRAGDARAATALYERSRPIVDRTVRKLLGRGDQDQQDLCQLAMVEIVRSIDRYRGESPLDAWIASLSAHVVYKALRHRRVERRVLSGVDARDVVGRDQPGRTAVDRSTIDRVRRHLEAMDHGRAWAFLLHDVHGYDLKEMAAIMAVSPAAAQSRLVRGRKELHDRIAADAELADALDHKGRSA
jgi:RNA polymerase sigma-70 factor (ECF subfamily)